MLNQTTEPTWQVRQKNLTIKIKKSLFWNKVTHVILWSIGTMQSPWLCNEPATELRDTCKIEREGMMKEDVHKKARSNEGDKHSVRIVQPRSPRIYIVQDALRHRFTRRPGQSTSILIAPVALHGTRICIIPVHLHPRILPSLRPHKYPHRSSPIPHTARPPRPNSITPQHVLAPINHNPNLSQRFPNPNWTIELANQPFVFSNQTGRGSDGIVDHQANWTLKEKASKSDRESESGRPMYSNRSGMHNLKRLTVSSDPSKLKWGASGIEVNSWRQDWTYACGWLTR